VEELLAVRQKYNGFHFLKNDKIVLNCIETSVSPPHKVVYNYTRSRKTITKILFFLKLIDKSKTQDHV